MAARKTINHHAHLHRDACCICHQLFGLDDPAQLKFEYDGKVVFSIHYKHFLEEMNCAGTYIPKPPAQLTPQFDLVRFLNAAREIIVSKPVSDIRALRSAQYILGFIDSLNLSKYIGGTAEFHTTGFYSQKAA